MRTPPFRYPPVSGEGFDSWLLSFANFASATPMDLLASSIAVGQRGHPLTPRSLALGHQGLNIDALARLANLDPFALHGMVEPLTTYRARVTASARLSKSRLASIAASSQACPACLKQSAGRWQASWRIGLLPACPLHRCWLINTCHACGAGLRKRAIRMELVPQDTTACEAPTGNATGRRPGLCGASLIDAELHLAPESIIRLCERLQHLFDSDAEEIEDAVTLASDWMIVTSVLTASGGAPKGIGSRSFTSDESIRDALTVGSEALLSGDISVFALLDDDRPTRHLSPVPIKFRRASDTLAAALVRERHPRLSPTDQLRWRSWIEPTRPLDESKPDGHGRRKWTPAALWPEVALCLLPPRFAKHSIFRRATSALLLVPGSTQTPEALSLALKHGSLSNSEIMSVTCELNKTTHGQSSLRYLAEIADRLDSGECPIDYDRRRSIPLHEHLLDMATWNSVAASGGMLPGDSRRLAHARIWLWECITGSEFESIHEDASEDADEITVSYPSFLRALTNEATRGLRSHASRVLATLGLTDEPVDWTPTLPEEMRPSGQYLTDMGKVARSGTSLGTVALSQGLTNSHVKLVLRLTSRPNSKLKPSVALKSMTAEQLSDLILGRKLTLREAAAVLGVSRETLSRHCQRLGIDYRTSDRRRTWIISEDWLRDQYVNHGRPMPDLAREIGCSPAQVSRMLAEFRIPVRGRGGSSHASSTKLTGVRGSLLRQAIRGQSGEQRVRRFMVLADCRSMNEAANRLGISQVTVLSQLSQLENAVGKPLLQRSTRDHKKHELTEHGRRLLREAAEHFGQPRGMKAPEPLASALRVFRGPDRLTHLLVLRDSPTLSQAAERRGTDPGSLARSIRNFEKSWGYRLTQGSPSRHRPIRLTSRGNLLLTQWFETSSVERQRN